MNNYIYKLLICITFIGISIKNKENTKTIKKSIQGPGKNPMVNTMGYLNREKHSVSRAQGY